MSEDYRRRFNSSMTYEEYMDVYPESPRTPILKPREIVIETMPELSLDSAFSPVLQNEKKVKVEKPYIQQGLLELTEDKSSNLNVIYEESDVTSVDQNQKLEYTMIPLKAQNVTKLRMRSKSDTFNLTCLTFLERRLKRQLREQKFEEKIIKNT